MIWPDIQALVRDRGQGCCGLDRVTSRVAHSVKLHVRSYMSESLAAMLHLHDISQYQFWSESCRLRLLCTAYITRLFPKPGSV